MKRYTLVFTFLALMGLSTACQDDFLDVNTDPNEASETTPDLLFTWAANNFSNNRTVDYGISGAFWSQIWSAGGSLTFSTFTNPERYIISIFTNGNTWRSHYREVQKNLVLAEDIARNSNPANPNAIAQCMIFRAMTYYHTTLMWGDVPYSQAVDLDGQELQTDFPEFDPQEQVLNGVITLLDEAVTLIDQGSEVPPINDLIYGGDMTLWREFARSLKFRTLMTMVDKDASKASAIQQMLQEGGMLSEDAAFPFYNTPGNQNPIYRVINEFTSGRNFWYIAPKTMVDLMLASDDPRLPIYFRPGDDAPADVYIGVAPGANGTTETAVINEGIIPPDFPDVLFSVSEQLFLEAEAEARFNNDLEAADATLREAVATNMAYWDVADADAQAYVDAMPALSTGDLTAARTTIERELWLSLQLRPFEAWTHWRRGLEVPQLELPEGTSANDIIRRLPYPPDELAANPNAPDVIPVDQKMWFDL
ncbi:Starch-binding associating with outer membrane [Catalinimonas alkaloidigena]|uniref:Starch-binding associating with outer membrane n=1 Tax=Catalinimonas alkaloidigena TaxID=1075417 RepID=A0A1G9QNU5_9BACT|nr:SusD/RagB family nutrient-binding outer membrane lipoprotein [Catalinimonas alkaloidigena]SDM12679.1 Starch-binding associating with outer membrane [Catalinimonas alkaloidigena]